MRNFSLSIDISNDLWYIKCEIVLMFQQGGDHMGNIEIKAVRGSYVADSVIKEAMREAEKQGLMVYDLARDYGLGFAVLKKRS